MADEDRVEVTAADLIKEASILLCLAKAYDVPSVFKREITRWMDERQNVALRLSTPQASPDTQMREALEPFARYARHIPERYDDATIVRAEIDVPKEDWLPGTSQNVLVVAMDGLKAGHFRNAFAALQSTPAPESAGEAALREALADVAAERARQINSEGWTPEHDDEHGNGELAAAAAAYAFSAATAGRYLAADPIGFWPWDVSWWKPKTPREDLVRAGALILAEIERIDRAARTSLDNSKGGKEISAP